MRGYRKRLTLQAMKPGWKNPTGLHCLRTALKKSSPSGLSFARFGCPCGEFHPPEPILVCAGGWDVVTDRNPALSRTLISYRDAERRLFGQMIPERSCPVSSGFVSRWRRRLSGRGAAQTGNPLFKRGVGREEMHEVPAGERVDDQHMRR